MVLLGLVEAPKCHRGLVIIGMSKSRCQNSWTKRNDVVVFDRIPNQLGLGNGVIEELLGDLSRVDLSGLSNNSVVYAASLAIQLLAGNPFRRDRW